jgi:putative membrane protein
MNSRTLALLSLLALAACGQRNETANLAVDNEATTNTALAVEPTGSQAFVNTAAASDRFEIESSRLAATSAGSASVKSFAANMVAAHTASTEKLKAAAASVSPAVTVDDALSAAQQQTLDGLKGKSGADFDRAYAAAQVDAHQAALDTLNDYAASGDNPALKDLARGLVPAVTAHLNMAKALQ